MRDKAIQLKSGGDSSLQNLLGPGSHGTTFGGTPLACAGALEVLDVIESEGLIANAKTLGAYAKQCLIDLASPLIKEVRGVGLMIGIELCADFAERSPSLKGDTRSPSLILVELLHAARLLTVPAGTHAVRWLPPLNVTREEIDRAVSILSKVLQQIA